MEDAPITDSSQETKTIRVHMPTFPPTAMVYSVNSTKEDVTTNTGDKVPMDLIAKVLKPSTTFNRKSQRYYVCCKCRVGVSTSERGVQTHLDSFIRTATADLSTNPPTIVAHYPGVHRPRNSSSGSDITLT